MGTWSHDTHNQRLCYIYGDKSMLTFILGTNSSIRKRDGYLREMMNREAIVR